jgi:hypothetical protein
MNPRTLIGLFIASAAALTVMAGPVLWPTAVEAAPLCSPDLNQRTPEEVVADFRAAMVAANWAAVRCNIDDDAVMISDNGVTNGEDEIVGELEALARFFGGSMPQQDYQSIVVPILGGNRSMARVLYTVDTVCSDIPDGIDTYVIKGGQIAALTTHGFIQFSC